MDIKGENLRPVDTAVFDQNRSRFPPEDLLPYAGHHIAWNADGTRVLASGRDMDEVDNKVIAAGIAPDQVVFDFIDPPDRVLL
jgi:hypothetical protein